MISTTLNYGYCPRPKNFLLIAASSDNAAAVNLRSTRTLFANGVSIFFVNGKATLVNRARKLCIPPSWLLIFLVIPLNNMFLFSKDLLTFAMSFVSLFVSVIPEPANNESFLLNFYFCIFLILLSMSIILLNLPSGTFLATSTSFFIS